MPALTPDVLAAAETIYEFHQVPQKAEPGDVIVALGTNDLRVAELAAELYLQGYGKWLVCTGGIAHQNDLLATAWTRPEAQMYAEIAEQRGVPREKILLESRALNTAENFRFSRAILADQGLEVRRIVIAVKPFMQRRAAATIAVEWPEVAYTMASPKLTLAEYFTPDLPPEKMIHILMGDLQRLWIYSRKGWSAPQEIPVQVMQAYRFLKAEGWTQHLLPIESR